MQLAPTALKIYNQIVSEKPELKEKVDQAVASAPQSAQLSAEKLTQLLVGAMPDHKQLFEKVGGSCMCHHPDKTNGKFVSSIASLMIEKERNAIYTAPAVTRPARDPLHAEIVIGKDADFVVLANGAVFDADKRPLAMKVLVRERADMNQVKKALASFHTTWADQPDVVKVPDHAAYHKLADQQEGEFRFGDPVAVVSFDAKGEEQGRNGMTRPSNRLITRLFHPRVVNGQPEPDTTKPVGSPSTSTGAALDTAPVQVFPNTVKLAVTRKAGAVPPIGSWLDERVANLTAALKLDQGLILEPDAQARATLLNSAVTTDVAANDFSFKGSRASSAEIALAPYATWDLQTLGGQSVQLVTRSNATPTDQQATNLLVRDLIYPDAKSLRVGKEAFVPFRDVVASSEKCAELGIEASLEPLAADPEADGAALMVKLPKGLFASENASALDGYSIEVGLKDSSGWHCTDAVKIKGGASSEGCFELTIPNLTSTMNGNLEIRLRNKDGLPATRLLMPMKQLQWA
ncbi:MAG: hypothetical protein HYV07_08650 [Deltaproteobacteria bacterium]|nr:hypothetical protein [Deltaproteobacteria bacterium]